MSEFRRLEGRGRDILSLYIRALKGTVRHSGDEEAAGLWQFGLTSLVGVLTPVIFLPVVVLSGDNLFRFLLGSLASLTLGLVSGLYMTYGACKAGLVSRSPNPRRPQDAGDAGHVGDGH